MQSYHKITGTYNTGFYGTRSLSGTMSQCAHVVSRLLNSCADFSSLLAPVITSATSSAHALTSPTSSAHFGNLLSSFWQPPQLMRQPQRKAEQHHRAGLVRGRRVQVHLRQQRRYTQTNLQSTHAPALSTVVFIQRRSPFCIKVQ